MTLTKWLILFFLIGLYGCGVTTGMMGVFSGAIVAGKGIENSKKVPPPPPPKPLPKPKPAPVIEKKVTVVLLENDDGSVGKITVSNEAGKQEIDQANHYTVLKNKKTAPKKPVKASDEMMKKRFNAVLSAQPLKPVSFLFYFDRGQAGLNDESILRIADVVEAAKLRTPAEIQLIGHADRAGDDAYNIKLSLERANVVLQVLKANELKDVTYQIKSHGENDLLIQTKDGVAEARNRRVEVIVR